MPLRRSPLRRVAWRPSARSRARTAARRVEWEQARDGHLRAVGWRCEACPILRERRDVLLGFRLCAPSEASAVDVHHVLARGMGGSRDHSRLAATCRRAHEWIEAHPAQAEQAGLKVRHS